MHDKAIHNWKDSKHMSIYNVHIYERVVSLLSKQPVKKSNCRPFSLSLNGRGRFTMAFLSQKPRKATYP